jgi:hypothetical protein
MLKVRAGSESNVLKGALAEQINKVSPLAFAAIVGQLPHDLNQVLAGGPIQATPERLRIETRPAGKDALEIDFHGKFKSEGDAKAFADGIRALRDKGVADLQNPPPLPPNIKLPPRTFGLLRNALQGLQMDAKGDAATGSMQVSRELVSLMPMMLFGFAAPGPAAPMPQQAPVPQKK